MFTDRMRTCYDFQFRFGTNNERSRRTETDDEISTLSVHFENGGVSILRNAILSEARNTLGQ